MCSPVARRGMALGPVCRAVALGGLADDAWASPHGWTCERAAVRGDGTMVRICARPTQRKLAAPQPMVRGPMLRQKQASRRFGRPRWPTAPRLPLHPVDEPTMLGPRPMAGRASELL